MIHIAQNIEMLTDPLGRQETSQAMPAASAVFYMQKQGAHYSPLYVSKASHRTQNAALVQEVVLVRVHLAHCPVTAHNRTSLWPDCTSQVNRSKRLH